MSGKDSHSSLEYYLVYVALMVLLALTVGAAFLKLGPFNIILAMMIALAKAALVVWIFMHMKTTNRLSLLFLGAGVAMLVISGVLTFSDYLSRQ